MNSMKCSSRRRPQRVLFLFWLASGAAAFLPARQGASHFHAHSTFTTASSQEKRFTTQLHALPDWLFQIDNNNNLIPSINVPASMDSSSIPAMGDWMQTIQDTKTALLESSLHSLRDVNGALETRLQSLVPTAVESLQHLAQQIQVPVIQQDELEQLAAPIQSALQSLVTQYPVLEPLATALQDTLAQEVWQRLLQETNQDGNNWSSLLSSPPVLLFLSATTTYMVMSSLLNSGSGMQKPSQPYPMERYDPATARAYFDDRLPQVLARGIEVALQSLSFGIKVLRDYNSDKLEENADTRAVELAQLLTTLGPSFIKIGQSLSIRTDLLSPAYVRGLQTLQDQVPPFDTKVAFQMLQDEWGVDDIYDVVSDITPEPVASASLGQVYKATIKATGQPVAIKVQRPNIMNQIALDMHLLREVAPVAKRTFNLNTDTVGTVDAWGKGFVDELDYLSEARNAESFMESIQQTPLRDVVFAPAVLEEYSTGKVLTTEWVDGERLDKSSSEDVTVLCSIAMNTYLTMMLETGLLHCDPHPGNLLRTKDGRLCILDWGMVTRLDKDLQLTLIEHVAHLTSRDYAEIPRDLLLLDFIPKEKADLIQDSGVVEVLADIYGSWTEGGGAAAVNVNEVVTRLQDLTVTRGNLFQIPPYFAYIAKSFSVLEGIGLSNNPKYSIINECLPYVSKRLLTDQSERTGGALSTFIFGPEKRNVDTRLVDYKRVEQLVTGFGNYTTSASGALLGRENVTRTELLEAASDQLLDLVFTEEETPLQTIFLEQMAKIISSSSRSILTELRERSGTLPSGRTVLGTLVDPLGFWRTSPLVRMNDLDSRTVETTRNLVALMQRQISESESPVFDLSTLSREEVLALSSILVRKVWNRRTGVLLTGNRLANQLLKLTADKLARGERDTIRLPEPQLPEPQKTEVEVVSGPTLASAEEGAVSDRLHKAKQRLYELEQEEMEPVQTVEPSFVKSDG